MVDPGRVEQFRVGILEWAASNMREFPWRDPEATFYEVFMAEMFLRRTRADVVETMLPEFLDAYPSLSALRGTEKDVLADVIRPMGLQNKRAQGLRELAAEIDGDELPRDRERLLDLPQVGPYVANASLCFALEEELPIVDRNVDRVYRRVFGDAWDTLREEEQYQFAEEVLPTGEARSFNLGLLDFASLVCTANEPACGSCFANGYCPYYQTGE
ncbi:hypothetical protein [Halorubellus salinus]|uniref:hypothetical protein n=1 Tax=Halorubellus salinus TaxID=755309 RepID=UPI001D075CCB|nr:hypothetical protein [Halorubellus salinus]